MKRIASEIIKERVSRMQELMKREGFDAYVIVSDDYHASEYASDYFKAREYLTGFDGSAGEVVVLPDRCYLWTDGRYYLQAGMQLENTGISLMKTGERDVPDIGEFLSTHVPEGGRIGYDGKTISVSFQKQMASAVSGMRISFHGNVDLIDEIWEDRPALPSKSAWLLDDRYAGQSRRNKIANIRMEMLKIGANYYLVSALDEVAWVLNLRGDDIAYNPVALAYMLIGERSANLYINPDALTPRDRGVLALDGVNLLPYERIYDDLSILFDRDSVLLDPEQTNSELMRCAQLNAKVLEAESPVRLPKACKNNTETENEKLAHLKDGIAVTRLLYYLHTPEFLSAVKEGRPTELDVSAKLLSFRRNQTDFIDQSFAPIIATGEHGAIIHYEPTSFSNIQICMDSFLLMDTGGQYLQGTTDITRTVAIGQVTHKMKEHYTAVLRGNLALSAAIFREGTTGANLDILARTPLWEMGLNYNHGTGHGVGYLLNVHEGPQQIRMGGTKGRLGSPILPGMITSDEPGLYLDGAYGIRLENLMVCKVREETEWGRFLCFDTLTLVPFDRSSILPERMTLAEKAILNAYHDRVYSALAPHLSATERVWLEQETAPI